ncbi:hypothetical protein AMTRI_Chr09g20010 [Amborella trichopoda]
MVSLYTFLYIYCSLPTKKVKNFLINISLGFKYIQNYELLLLDSPNCQKSFLVCDLLELEKDSALFPLPSDGLPLCSATQAPDLIFIYGFMALLAVSNSCFRFLCSFGPGFLPLVFCWEEARGVGRGGRSLPRVSGCSCQQLASATVCYLYLCVLRWIHSGYVSAF